MRKWMLVAVLALAGCGDFNATVAPEISAALTATAQRPASPSPLIAPTLPANTDTPAPVPTQSPEDRYITIAQGSAMPNIRPAMGMEDGPWAAKVINVGAGPELELRAPLNPATSNEQFVLQARRNIAQMINGLFVADPQLARIALIGTFPDQAGESPAVSVIVLRSASADWGTVTADQLDGLAERVDIKPEYR